jgi:hypothetical protein
LAKTAFNKNKTLFISKLDLNLRKNLVKCYTWSINFYVAGTWTLRKIDQKYLDNFTMWCWRRVDKIIWTNLMRNEGVLQRVKKDRNILQTIKRRKAHWICHVLRRNCLLKHVIEGKIEERMDVTVRRGRRRKQLMDDVKEKRRHWKLKEKALDRTVWRTRFGRGYGLVIRQTNE